MAAGGLLASTLRHERVALAVVLVGLPAVCWGWVIAMGVDMYGSMSGASAWMMSFTWDARRLLLLWAMWAAMMAAMMLPAAAPILLLYSRAARAKRNDSRPHYGFVRGSGVISLAVGYLAVWAGFSVAATALQRLLATQVLLTPMMEPATPLFAAGVLVAAGVYQFTPFKQACLTTCRSPLAFLMQRWRPGAAGALRMGIEHGAYCLGCCWALMLLLFAGGVMNLWVILALTVWVAIEKLAPFGQQSARIGGALLLVLAAWMVIG
jgi:predicted metal-binding membrane protein